MLFLWKQQDECWGLHQDGQWHIVASWAKLVQLIQTLPPADRTSAVLFVTTAEFITAQHQLPAKQARVINPAAASYLLDGMTMMPVDALRVRYKSELKPAEPIVSLVHEGAMEQTDDTPLATVNVLALEQQTPNNYHQLLGLASVSLLGLLPDFLLLPVPDVGKSSILLQKDGLLLRHSQWFGEFIDNVLLEEPAVVKALESRNITNRVVADAEQASKTGSNAAALTPDVLSHPYNFVVQTQVKGLSPYTKWLLVVFVMLAVIMSLGFILKTKKIVQLADMQHAQNEQHMRTLLQGKEILPPVLSLSKMQSMLKTQKERLPEQEFLAVQLFDGAAGEVAATGCKLTAAQYEATQLQLQVVCDSLAQINLLVDRVRQAGHTVDQSGAEERAGRATSVLMIGGGVQ